MNDSDMMDKRELISALADGQLRGDGLARGVDAAASDEGRGTWHAYCMIGEVLRSGRASAGVAPDAFLAKLRAHLQDEPARAPETVLAAKEIAATVNSAMEALPEELRQAVTLREIEGLSYEEIAEVMNCPIGTVRSRIFRAREAISAKVKPMLENQSGKRW